jgi:hypothetical protein
MNARPGNDTDRKPARRTASMVSHGPRAAHGPIFKGK